jgi:hypothetical protein
MKDNDGDYRDDEGRLLYCPCCGANTQEGYPAELLYGKPDPGDPPLKP